jgi:hypothetical protein
MQNMLAYSTDWYGHKTFRLMPITNDCPFVEAIYDPTTKVLAIIGKTTVEKPIMLPKLNDKGENIPVKGSNPAQPRFVEERRILSTFTEYYMDNMTDITTFIDRFVVNHDAAVIAETLFPNPQQAVESIQQPEQEG